MAQTPQQSEQLHILLTQMLTTSAVSGASTPKPSATKTAKNRRPARVPGGKSKPISKAHPMKRDNEEFVEMSCLMMELLHRVNDSYTLCSSLFGSVTPHESPQQQPKLKTLVTVQKTPSINFTEDRNSEESSEFRKRDKDEIASETSNTFPKLLTIE